MIMIMLLVIAAFCFSRSSPPRREILSVPALRLDFTTASRLLGQSLLMHHTSVFPLFVLPLCIFLHFSLFLDGPSLLFTTPLPAQIPDTNTSRVKPHKPTTFYPKNYNTSYLRDFLFVTVCHHTKQSILKVFLQPRNVKACHVSQTCSLSRVK
jgi:hypothetical protein